jgi:hypothetical protein
MYYYRYCLPTIEEIEKIAWEHSKENEMNPRERRRMNRKPAEQYGDLKMWNFPLAQTITTAQRPCKK